MAINSRSKRRDPNTGKYLSNSNVWVFDDNAAYCYLGNELLFFTDLDVYMNLMIDKSFSKLANGYSATRINGKGIAVHRLVVNAQPGVIVDHINRNKKDNRIINLRLTNKSVNAFNSKIRNTNTSGVTGVWFRKDTKKWVAEIKVNYKKITLGSFKNKSEAIKARSKAEAEYYGC